MRRLSKGRRSRRVSLHSNPDPPQGLTPELIKRAKELKKEIDETELVIAESRAHLMQIQEQCTHVNRKKVSDSCPDCYFRGARLSVL